jgi:UDP-glucose 4-epimerase
MYDDSIRVVPLFIRLARKNEPLTVFGKDKCLDFTYIDDAVSGVQKILDRFDAVTGDLSSVVPQKGAKVETINLATGKGTTIIHLAERVKELLGSSSEIMMGKPRTGEVIRYVADIAKARKLLEYDPKNDFEMGIVKAVEWYKSV